MTLIEKWDEISLPYNCIETSSDIYLIWFGWEKCQLAIDYWTSSCIIVSSKIFFMRWEIYEIGTVDFVEILNDFTQKAKPMACSTIFLIFYTNFFFKVFVKGKIPETLKNSRICHKYVMNFYFFGEIHGYCRKPFNSIVIYKDAIFKLFSYKIRLNCSSMSSTIQVTYFLSIN